MNDLFPFVETLLKQFAEAMPKLLMAILVLIIGYIISKIFASVVKKLFKSIGIDKLAEKLDNIEIIQKANVKIVPSTIFSKIIYYLLLLIFIVMATDILDISAISTLFRDIVDFVPNLIVALIVLFLGLLFSDFVRQMVLTLAKSLNLPSANMIANAIFYFLLINVLITALKQTGISTNFVEGNFMILIGGGVLAFALGYGLAAKDLVSNFLSSFYIKDQFNVGDQVKIDGIQGEISEIDKSFLKINTGTSTVLIPLSKTLKDKIEIEHK